MQTGTSAIKEKSKRKERAVAGELAQMVERSLSMREVVGSMPTFSSFVGRGSLGGILKSSAPLKKMRGVLNAAVLGPFFEF